jgi:hypothetical protein
VKVQVNWALESSRVKSQRIESEITFSSRTIAVVIKPEFSPFSTMISLTDGQFSPTPVTGDCNILRHFQFELN